MHVVLMEIPPNYLASAQPPPSCSFARHLVGKMAIFCSFAHHEAQPSYHTFALFDPPQHG